MAKLISLTDREYESFVDTGSEKSIEITLSGTPGTITTVTLPDTAKGFRLYPRSNHIRFSVYTSSTRAVAAVGTSATTPVVATDFTIGGIAKSDQWETRLLPSFDGTNSRYVQLRSITASVVIDFEVF